jgi:hypothetical protein
MARPLRNTLLITTPKGDSTMDKHIAMAVFVGGIFAATIASMSGIRRPRCRWLRTGLGSVRLGRRPVYRRLDRGELCDACDGREGKGRSRRAQPKRGTRRGVTCHLPTGWSASIPFCVPCRLAELESLGQMLELLSWTTGERWSIESRSYQSYPYEWFVHSSYGRRFI